MYRFVFLIMALVGCATTESIPENLPAAPDDFEASCGSGGGNPNVWNGYTLKADGQAQHWSGLRIELETETVGMVGNDDLATFWYYVGQAGFFDVAKNGLGDQTAILEITGGGKKHRASWAVTDAMGKPDALQQLFAQCQQLAQQAQP